MSFYKKEDIERLESFDREEKYTVDCQKAVENGEEIRVEQNHKAETDINNIVKKHAGNLELVQKNSELVEFNMDNIPTNDFQEMMTIMVKAKQAFESVPSKIRAQFDHDPAKYMDFVRNPENKETLIEMGLAHAPEAVDNSPIEVIVTNQEPPPSIT